MSVERVAIFWVVNARSGEQSCLQFSIPTGSGAGGEGGVSHSLKDLWYWIWLRSIGALKFFEIQNFLNFSSKISNFVKFWRCCYHFCYQAQILCANALIRSHISYEIWWKSVEAFEFCTKFYWSFLCEKPKSNNVLPWRKTFIKSVRKEYKNRDSHAFLNNCHDKLLKIKNKQVVHNLYFLDYIFNLYLYWKSFPNFIYNFIYNII